MKSLGHKFDQRHGHSMMEMMVVMSVLAGMAALSWPMLKTPLDKLRLQSAAQEVTAELSKARLKAMQSGVPQVFRFQMNTGKFQVSAVTDEETSDESSAEAPEQLMVDANSTGVVEHSPLTDESDLQKEEKELPEGICFEMPVAEESTESAEAEETANEQGWTDLATFYPNGGTTSAVVGLRGDPDLHVDVKLSGLTGIAKIGETHRQELR